MIKHKFFMPKWREAPESLSHELSKSLNCLVLRELIYKVNRQDLSMRVSFFGDVVCKLNIKGL